MASPADLRYTRTHEWARRDGDVVTIGITDHAQSELGDITFLELPEVGSTVLTNEPFGVVESVKAASDVFAPVEGEVIERNEDAIATPDLVNSSPYDRAWLIKLRAANPEQIDELMAPADYDAYAEATGH
ncbi:MAG TPA: glycine cleavage system protein GcvH [Thermomicrobiales bacterium]|nr:glycine cleavage system protein GcvH [Thermomicrobiales bacterium]